MPIKSSCMDSAHSCKTVEGDRILTTKRGNVICPKNGDWKIVSYAIRLDFPRMYQIENLCYF